MLSGIRGGARLRTLGTGHRMMRAGISSFFAALLLCVSIAHAGETVRVTEVFPTELPTPTSREPEVLALAQTIRRPMEAVVGSAVPMIVLAVGAACATRKKSQLR